MMTDRDGAWVYAVGSAGAGDGTHTEGIGGEPVRALPGPAPGPASALVAFVSTVPLGEFGEEALRGHLEDLDWLAAVARRHHAVVTALAAGGPVVPMRLATVFSSDAGVVGMLSERADALAEALERARSGREWGVKAYAAVPAPGARPGQRPKAPEGASPGAAYLSRRRTQLASERDGRRAAVAEAAAAHAELSRLARASRRHPAQAPALAGVAAPMLLNGSYLVGHDQADAFARTVGELAARSPAIRLELTGPWPPYSFAAVSEGEP